MAQQALTTRHCVCGRFTLGIGPSHHWIIEEQLGLSYQRPAHQVRDYLEVLARGFRLVGTVDVEYETLPGAQPVSTSPTPARRRCCWPPSGRRCCAWPASTPTEPSCGWPTDAPSPSTSSPASPRPLTQPAGRPRIVAGVPVALCSAQSGRPGARPRQSGARPRRAVTELPERCSTAVTPTTSATPWPPATRPRS